MEKTAGAATVQTREVGSGVVRIFYHYWRLILALAVTLLIGIVILLLRFFPYSEKNITESLQQTFPGQLRIYHFQPVYFPHPGCRAERVTFRSNSSPSDSPPVVAIQWLTIQGSYADLLLRPHHVARVYLDGLRVQVPPLGSAGAFNGGYRDSQMTIGEVVANRAVLEFARAGDKPAERYDIHELSLNNVTAQSGMGYRLIMRNPTPPGEITSTGHFGPFISNDPAQTPVSGSYSFNRADISAFRGIAGIVDSRGTFSGPLERVDVQGTTESPNFEVVRSGHAAHLSTRFHLRVNGMNGDVALTDVNASYIDTTIRAAGSVAGNEGWGKKLTSLDFEVHDGRIQDMLRLIVREKQPPMSGVTNFKAHVTVPPEGKPFLKEVTLQGNFDIADGHFAKPTRQQSVNELSRTAQGQKKANPEEKIDGPVDQITSHVQGNVELRDGMATFANLQFTVPGAAALMHGTYNLLNEKIDLHGTLKMDAKFSNSTSGIKSLFAKVLDPFLNKKGGAVVPVLVDGTYGNPHFGLDLNPVKK